ncbi:MAG: hypothetical protein LBR76_01195 [Oscillospiraceae bacterium]|jgi:hypothetical protein|nr:hypothetical protein [Oscillospiraceae bacterium]
MIQKKAVIGAAAFFLVAALFVGYFALAAEIGGKDNPLVTLDYLKSLNPQIEADIEALVNEKVEAKIGEINELLAQASETIDSKVGSGGGGDISALASDEAFINSIAAALAPQIGGTVDGETGLGSFKGRTVIEPGKSVFLPEGTCIMLRLGTATVVASNSPGLIDLTDGTQDSELENGEALKVDHLYTVTMEAGREVKNTGSGNVTVFIWGPYTTN